MLYLEVRVAPSIGATGFRRSTSCDEKSESSPREPREPLADTTYREPDSCEGHLAVRDRDIGEGVGEGSQSCVGVVLTINN